MDKVKERLQTELQKAQMELQELDQRLDQRPEFGLGKASPRAYSWEIGLARRESVITRIGFLQEALDRVGEGCYGRCRRCGEQINPERLEILPATTLCIACARAAAGDPMSRQGTAAHAAIQR